MKAIPFSDIRIMFEKVAELQKQGRSPVPFHIGQPDFDTPAYIKQAAKEALDRGMTAYTSNYGLPALRQAVAEKLAVENGFQVDPASEIIITVGTNEAILLAMLATLNPGDEVLIPDPSWLHYFYCARLAGAVPVSVPLRPENDFQLDLSELRQRVTPRTRMLLLNSPHNPTGSILSRATIADLAEFVLTHDLLLLSDEIYEKMIYSGESHLSPASLPGMQTRTITVNGFSKIYAMTGWRIGYLAASRRLVSAMIRVHQYTTICATSFAQAGALAALTGPQEAPLTMMAEFARRRQAVVQGLQQVPGLDLVPPQGAFYAFPGIRRLGLGSEEFATRLLETTGVAVIPGKAFGAYGEGFIRISFACSLAQIEQGLKGLSDFCTRLG